MRGRREGDTDPVRQREGLDSHFSKSYTELNTELKSYTELNTCTCS